MVIVTVRTPSANWNAPGLTAWTVHVPAEVNVSSRVPESIEQCAVPVDVTLYDGDAHHASSEVSAGSTIGESLAENDVSGSHETVC